MQFKNSRFFQLIDNAITSDSTSMIKTLYELEGVVDENLSIIYPDDPEIFEKAIRFLVDCDILFKCLNAKILVLEVPCDKVDEVIWFVKLFGFLESEVSNWELGEEDLAYLPNKNHQEVFLNPRISLELNIDSLKFMYKDLQVEVQIAENLTV